MHLFSQTDHTINRARTLPAFTDVEYQQAHAALAANVALMMGRKFEEGDWAEVYCTAKNIPNTGWSNLKLDIVHQGLGVEHKMLRFADKPDLTAACGTRHMHPAATRSFRMPSVTLDPDEAMRQVLTQYAQLIEMRRASVQVSVGPGQNADLRTGWLIWQSSLRQFLYFEEEMLAPDVNDYFAEWHTREPRGTRKGSTNLWIYERDTRQKKFSVTNEAGSKIQPYFDIPPASDKNLYLFTVIGEYIDTDYVRVWLTRATLRELESIIGYTDTDTISTAILETTKRLSETGPPTYDARGNVVPIVITASAYAALASAIPGASDEHCFQQLVDFLKARA